MTVSAKEAAELYAGLFGDEEQPVGADTAAAAAALDAEAELEERVERRAKKRRTTAASEELRIAPPPLVTYKRTLGGKERPAGKQFRAVYANAGELGALLAKLRAVMPSVQLQFGPSADEVDNLVGSNRIDGLRIETLNEARVSFVELSVPRRSFILYEGQPQTPCDSVACYTRFFFDERRAMKSTHTLTLSRYINGDDSEPLGVLVHPAHESNRQARVTAAHVTAIDGERQAYPRVDSREWHQYAVLMETKTLQDIVVQSKDRFDELVFALTDDRLQVTGRAPGAQGGVTMFGISYDAGTMRDSLTLPAEHAIGSFAAPRDDPGAVGAAERAAFDSIVSQRANGVELCRLERLPFAPAEIGRKHLDNVRLKVKFLDEAMKLSHASDFVELRFGRLVDDHSMLGPVRVCFRVLDAERARALITTMVHITPLIDEKA